MIIASGVVVVVDGTIGEMRRGRHTLGLSYCGRSWQFISWRATRFVLVDIETTTTMEC